MATNSSQLVGLLKPRAEQAEQAVKDFLAPTMEQYGPRAAEIAPSFDGMACDWCVKDMDPRGTGVFQLSER